MSNFNRKINKLLVRIFQQGWYFYDQKTKFSENAKKTISKFSLHIHFNLFNFRSIKKENIGQLLYVLISCRTNGRTCHINNQELNENEVRIKVYILIFKDHANPRLSASLSKKCIQELCVLR